jgi:hypothetical protein
MDRDWVDSAAMYEWSLLTMVIMDRLQFNILAVRFVMQARTGSSDAMREPSIFGGPGTSGGAGSGAGSAGDGCPAMGWSGWSSVRISRSLMRR